MPDLNVITYDENKGEWFPYQGVDNDNTRTRAMYFFHNSLGEAVSNVQIGFTDQIITGGSGSGDSNNDVDLDIQSWPILDSEGFPIVAYSNGQPCYRYRFNANNDGIPTKARFRIWEPPTILDDGTGQNQANQAIFNRYVTALKKIFSPQTASIRLNRAEDSSSGNPNGNFWQEDDDNTLPFNADWDFPVYNETPDNENSDSGYNIVCFGSGDILTTAVDLQTADGIPRFPDERIGASGGLGVNSGIIEWNAITVGGGTTTPETIEGFFMIDPDEGLGYQRGDYLLLEAADKENEFHNRVVLVNSVRTTSDSKTAYEIILLDDIGFFTEDQEDFTITKLTNAPKLKIRYTIPDSTLDGNITVVDDEPDVS